MSKLDERVKLVLFLVVALVVALLVIRYRGDGRSAPPGAYNVDMHSYEEIPADKVGWTEEAGIALTGEVFRALAVGPDGTVYVAADAVIDVYRPDGVIKQTLQMDEPVMALAVQDDRRIVAALERHLRVFTTDGADEQAFQDLGERARLTSVSIAGDRIFTADCGNRTVWSFSWEGEMLGQYAGPDASGFIIPSPYFDVAAADGNLWVVDPGRQTLMLLTPDFERISSWGKSGMDLEGFPGCCNPSHIASTPTGQVVTSEKGLARIKVYGTDGRLVSVVATPAQFTGSHGPFDVAVDRAGRVLVLDPSRKMVRIFTKKTATQAGENE